MISIPKEFIIFFIFICLIFTFVFIFVFIKMHKRDESLDQIETDKKTDNANKIAIVIDPIDRMHMLI